MVSEPVKYHIMLNDSYTENKDLGMAHWTLGGLRNLNDHKRIFTGMNVHSYLSICHRYYIIMFPSQDYASDNVMHLDALSTNIE